MWPAVWIFLLNKYWISLLNTFIVSTIDAWVNGIIYFMIVYGRTVDTLLEMVYTLIFVIVWYKVSHQLYNYIKTDWSQNLHYTPFDNSGFGILLGKQNTYSCIYCCLLYYNFVTLQFISRFEWLYWIKLLTNL